MSTLIYTRQRSKLSKKQREARSLLLKQQRAIKRELAQVPREDLTLTMTSPRTTQHYPSRGTGIGNAVVKRSDQYTGSNIIGLATLHKSNCVPVFSQNEAEDISRMRR